MLQANTTHQMATDDNEWGNKEKNEMPAKCPPDGDGEKVELVWTHIPDEQLEADKTNCIWHGRWIRNLGKTKQRVARRHQGMVPDGRALSKLAGAIKNWMETVCETRGWHQRALSPWIVGWMEHISRCSLILLHFLFILKWINIVLCIRIWNSIIISLYEYHGIMMHWFSLFILLTFLKLTSCSFCSANRACQRTRDIHLATIFFILTAPHFFICFVYGWLAVDSSIAECMTSCRSSFILCWLAYELPRGGGYPLCFPKTIFFPCNFFRNASVYLWATHFHIFWWINFKNILLPGESVLKKVKCLMGVVTTPLDLSFYTR